MKIDIEAIWAALNTAQAAFEAVHDIADDVALVLANDGQPELKTRLLQLRAMNDVARARRHEKLTAAATSG